MLNNNVALHTVRTIQGEYGDRSGMYIFVKTGKKTIKGYCGDVALYYTDSNPTRINKPWLIITPGKVEFCNRTGLSRYNSGESIPNIAHQVGSLIRVGIFNGIKVNWVRTENILNCHDDQFICIAPFTLDFDGNLIKAAAGLDSRTQKHGHPEHAWRSHEGSRGQGLQDPGCA